jgi:hypothetical protein
MDYPIETARRYLRRFYREETSRLAAYADLDKRCHGAVVTTPISPDAVALLFPDLPRLRVEYPYFIHAVWQKSRDRWEPVWWRLITQTDFKEEVWIDTRPSHGRFPGNHWRHTYEFPYMEVLLNGSHDR